MEYVHRRNKKRIKPRKSGLPSSGDGGKFRELYALLWKNRSIMPSELAKQPPRLLFNMLDADEEEEEEEISPHLKMFYGM